MAKEAGPTIARETNKALRVAAQAGVTAAKASVLGDLPGHVATSSAHHFTRDQRWYMDHVLTKRQRRTYESRQGGLRQGIARGVHVAFGVKSGIRIASTSSALPSNQKGMNRVYRLKSWRHPVMGNRKVWVEQLGKDWFYGPIAERAEEMKAALVVAVNVASEKISKGV